MAIESELICFLQSPGESLAGFAVAAPVALVPRAFAGKPPTKKASIMCDRNSLVFEK